MLTFGKYTGQEVRKTPKWYREWLLANFQFGKFNEKVKNEIIRLKGLGI
jgi:uncharacterized protein (DUF3820 family)